MMSEIIVKLSPSTRPVNVGPITPPGLITTRFKSFASANSQAACSANVLLFAYVPIFASGSDHESVP